MAFIKQLAAAKAPRNMFPKAHLYLDMLHHYANNAFMESQWQNNGGGQKSRERRRHG